MLELPWVLVELVIHAMVIRRMCVESFDIPEDLRCVEFFAGGVTSGQVAKAFSEVGCNSLAFDISRLVATKVPCCHVLQKLVGNWVQFGYSAWLRNLRKSDARPD